MRKVSGIIEDTPAFGLRDMGSPAFWFSVRFEESYGALIIMSIEKMRQLVIDNNVNDIANLKGKPCWLEVSDDNIVTFKDLWK